MPDQLITLHCAYCKKDSKQFIHIPQRRGGKSKTKQVVCYCQMPSCQKANIITIPESWGGSGPVWGGGEREGDNIPVIQGEKAQDDR